LKLERFQVCERNLWIRASLLKTFRKLSAVNYAPAKQKLLEETFENNITFEEFLGETVGFIMQRIK